MNKTLISILLLTIVASAVCTEDAQFELEGRTSDVLSCINNGAKLVQHITGYLKDKKWFNTSAVKNIAFGLNDTYKTCDKAFRNNKVSLLQKPVDLAVSYNCRVSLNRMKSLIETMKSNIKWHKWGTFKQNFYYFKSLVLKAKHQC
jgi:hypothetical protein